MNSKRYYTPLEANQAIPEIEPLVRELSHRAARLRCQNARGPGGARRRRATDSPVDSTYFRELLVLNEDLRQFGKYGCMLKDLDSGLVDFPARLEGRDVFLCWRLGEETISHWHEIDGGFRGRRRIEEGLRFEGGKI
ncbi:MAG: DUF2203 domain-containing protein [Acidobacteriota bacterium]